MPIFDDNKDRWNFLGIFEEVVDRFDWFCYAYCLMDNHYHLLVETVEGNLSRGMRHLNGVYTQRFNFNHDRVGHIFQGRFKSILVERDSYLLELVRYVVLNPVRAGMVKHPGDYDWSSYKATLGLVKLPAFLTVDWILKQFSQKRNEARREYRKFIQSGIGKVSVWEELKSQFLLGGSEFIEKISPALKDKREIIEVPKRERFVARPSLEEVLQKERTKNKDERNKLIRRAYFEYKFTMAEIAKCLGLHYSTISRIIKEML